MKKILFVLGLLSLTSFAIKANALPVFSANGFICGKEGTTVTCKGPIPGGHDSITGTGHDLVYLTINTGDNSQPLRYTYFSDTGCLLGYSFNALGAPVKAVAVHRNGTKKTFTFEDGKYEAIIDFCLQESPSGDGKSLADNTTPSNSQPSAASTSTKTTAASTKPATPAKKATPALEKKVN